MNNTNNNISDVDAYIAEVRKALGKHPEAEDIVQELKEHIFDYANQLSRNSKMALSVNEAFTIALQSMEDPETMAKSFKYEPLDESSSWKEPKSPIPEKKLSDRDFLFMGIIGFFVATVILSIISWVDEITQVNLQSVNFILTYIQFLLVLGLILAFLYYRNEQEFNNQLEKLRKKFEKINEDKTPKEATTWTKVLELHIEGLFEVVFSVIALIAVLHVTFNERWTLFNDNWYTIGIVVFVVSVTLEFIRGSLKLFIGQIRITRLVNAVSQSVVAVASFLLIIFYPFNIKLWFEGFTNPSAIMFREWILRTNPNPDAVMIFLLSISVIFTVMDAIYNFVKFGLWKPSHQKSLTMPLSQEEVQ